MDTKKPVNALGTASELRTTGHASTGIVADNPGGDKTPLPRAATGARTPQNPNARPVPLRPIFENIPAELVRQGARFACFDYYQSGGKWTKLPMNAKTGKAASSTDPETWSTFEEARAVYRRDRHDGIMFALSPDDLIVAIDLDHCVAEDGKIDPEAAATVRRFNSYTELSPSGRGLRIFIKGLLPAHGRHKGPAEVYQDKRFMTLTGHRIDGSPKTIEDRPVELAAWHLDIFGPAPDLTTGPTLPAVFVDLDDVDLIEKAKAARNGDKFARLWAGDTGDHGGDHSAADLALCDALAFWTGRDPDRMDRLFRLSGLMRPKWERADYRGWTIDKAITGCRDTYTPPTATSGSAPFRAAACPPELIGTPDEPCQVRIRELEAEVWELRALVDDLAADRRDLRAIKALVAAPEARLSDNRKLHTIAAGFVYRATEPNKDGSRTFTNGQVAAAAGRRWYEVVTPRGETERRISDDVAQKTTRLLVASGVLDARREELGSGDQTRIVTAYRATGDSLAGIALTAATIADPDRLTKKQGGHHPKRETTVPLPECRSCGGPTDVTLRGYCDGCGACIVEHHAPAPTDPDPEPLVAVASQDTTDFPRITPTVDDPEPQIAVLVPNPGRTADSGCPPQRPIPSAFARAFAEPADASFHDGTGERSPVGNCGNASQVANHGSPEPTCIDCHAPLNVYGVKRCDPCRRRWLSEGGG